MGAGLHFGEGRVGFGKRGYQMLMGLRLERQIEQFLSVCGKISQGLFSFSWEINVNVWIQ